MFKDKTAVVTGAGSGIGRALALKLADEKCNLALIDINAESLHNTSDMLSNSNVKVSIHTADLSDKAQVTPLPQKVFQTHNRVDFLFNIAGVAAGGSFEELEVDVFEKAIKINFFSQIYMMKAFWSFLKESPKAYIVNMSSITGKAAFAKNSAYSSSKFAIAGFTDSVAFEMEKSNIRLSAVYPGLISTDIVSNAISSGGNGDPNSPFLIAQGISPRKAAESILKGVRKDKQMIFVGKDAKLLYLLQKFFPVGYWSLIRKYVKAP